MDSGYKQEQYQHHYQDEHLLHHQINPTPAAANGGLTRFRSAPTSYFATFLDSPHTTTAVSGETREDFSSVRPLSPETEGIFASFMAETKSHELCNIPENSAVQLEYLVQVKQERENLHHYHYQTNSKPPSSSASNSSLKRQSSSPAVFFNTMLDIDNDSCMMTGMGNYGARNGQTNFSQGQPSSTSELLTQNSDFAGKKFSNSTHTNNDSNYNSGNSMKSWEDSFLSENFSSLERAGGDDGSQTFSELNTSENQIGEGRNRLAHHLSLPSSSAMDRLLQFQDTTPLRIRAKRGCATHPRSIAERVRRTKISDRMRKLQDIVPSMDKQTNTADMLDLAVEYIKDLQNKVKNLNDKRTACTCPR